MTRPTHLRVEHVDEPLGLTVPAPRLSWRLPAGTGRQLAYRIRAGEWDSGRVESGQSVLVPYGGPALTSGRRVSWTVQVWTEAGESPWAEPAWWEMGLLDPSHWAARWIMPAPPAEPDGVWLARGGCELAGPVERARLYATAYGVYEFFVNGHRVGTAELTPGFTSYRSTLQVQAFDVTELVQAGPNTLGAMVSGGWVGWTRRYRDSGLAGVLAQLDVVRADGSLVRYGTGPDWTTATGAVRTAHLWQGQVVDFRRDRLGWSEPGADGDGWMPAVVRGGASARFTSSPAPPVRRVQELRPVAVTRPAPDRQVADFGQNLNGWVRLTNLGPAGTTLTLTHGEALDAAGDVTTDHLTLGSEDPELFQVDRVTSAGRPDDWFEPRHTTHGFQYLRIEGHPEDLTPADVTGVVVHTDLRRTGWFECSDERINRLHEAAVWSFRGNACEIPTDCPTRERAGWTGDWQVFAAAAAFLYDVAGFSAKWLRDLATEQGADGVVGHCVPEGMPVALQLEGGMPPGSAGAGDAAVVVPWELYRAYGDVRLLAEQWPSMTAWVGYGARQAAGRRHPSRVAARPVPAAHEQYLWDTGFHWGEWLEPDALLDTDPHAYRELFRRLTAADHGDFATAYLHRSATLLARIGTVLGRADDAARYAALAGRTRAAWQAECLGPDGRVTPHTQAGYVRALAFDLVPPALREGAAGHLVGLVRAAGTHLGTGFFATPYLLPVLAGTGHLDVAYELLCQDTEPSWLTMIDRGASTIWEHWSGIDADGVPHHSLNHYSKGAVVSFLHRYVAGLQLLDDGPAYRRFRIAPRPGGGLTSASAAHESPYGRIEVAWRLDGDRFELDLTVPPGSAAAVHLPDGRRAVAGPGTSAYRSE